MDKFCQILTVICPRHIFLFRWKLSKYHWIFTKLGMCIDIVEIWFGIANGQISSNFDKSYLPATYFCFRTINLIVRSGLGLLQANFSIFYRVVCPWQDNDGLLSYYIFFLISPWKHMLWYSLEVPQHFKALLMSTHNIGFRGEITKYLPDTLLIWRYGGLIIPVSWLYQIFHHGSSIYM